MITRKWVKKIGLGSIDTVLHFGQPRRKKQKTRSQVSGSIVIIITPMD
jgi:hypothetical protein